MYGLNETILNTTNLCFYQSLIRPKFMISNKIFEPFLLSFTKVYRHFLLTFFLLGPIYNID